MAAPVDPSVAMNLDPVALSDWLAVAPVALGLGAGALMLIFRRRVGWQAPIGIAALGLIAVLNLLLLMRVNEQGIVTMTMGRWLPPFGISFTVDMLGALFALTGSVVALCCGIVAHSDIGREQRRFGFFPFLVLTATGVNGAFLTGDIFNLYVWFEVFLIASFGMLVIGSSRAQLEGTMKYAVLNLIGTTIFLIATGYLYGVFGTLNMADLMRRVPYAGGAPLMTLTALFLLAFTMKAAAFPVQAWLPASYHTPAPATAAFFGAVLTKVGIYALIRVLVMILPAQLFLLKGTIGVVAGATMLFASLAALAQSDIRRMMGFLVIYGVGVMLCGLAVQGALAGAIFYALHSMIALAAAYLLAGVIRQRCGTASLHRLGGLFAASPWLAGLALILSASIAGLPFGSGLWPKVMIVRAAISAEAYWLTAAILVSSLITILVLGRLYLLAFWRPAGQDQVSNEGPMTPTWVISLLVGVSLMMALWPEPFGRVSQIAAETLLAPGAYVYAVFPDD